MSFVAGRGFAEVASEGFPIAMDRDWGPRLNDLVSYDDEKHNDANGEGNQDGENSNYSFNCGVEGPTWCREVERTRLRQVKNMVATLFLSQGVPMLVYGNECRRTQRGNNNAWCQDNEVSWFDWRLVRKHRGLRRFCQGLIAFRRSRARPAPDQLFHRQARRARRTARRELVQPRGRRNGLGRGPAEPGLPVGRAAASVRGQPARAPRPLDVPRGTESCRFAFPAAARDLRWRLFVNTATKSPGDIYLDLDGPPVPADGAVTLEPRSLVCWIAPAGD